MACVQSNRGSVRAVRDPELIAISLGQFDISNWQLAISNCSGGLDLSWERDLCVSFLYNQIGNQFGRFGISN